MVMATPWATRGLGPELRVVDVNKPTKGTHQCVHRNIGKFPQLGHRPHDPRNCGSSVGHLGSETSVKGHIYVVNL